MNQTKCLGRRWAALWIDMILISIFLISLNYLLGQELYQKLIAIWLIVIALYYPILEGLYGASLGKFLFGIRVIDMDGNVPGIKKSILRTIPRIIETNPIFAGGVPAAISYACSKKNQRLGDMLAGTIVVRKANLDEPQNN